MKLTNPHIVLEEGKFYGIVLPEEPTDIKYAPLGEQGKYEVIYHIDLIKYDLPDRMRYIKATSENTYEWADRDPGIPGNTTDIRGMSVRYDRIVPQREVDGFYVSDPFAGDETKNVMKRRENLVAAEEEPEAETLAI